MGFKETIKRIFNSKLAAIITIFATVLTVISILWSTYLYIMEKPSRERTSIFEAWKILTTHEHRKGSGGRQKAIEQLKEFNENFTGINLEDAVIDGIDLSNINLSLANFKNTILPNCSFKNSILEKTTFEDSQIKNGNFYSVIFNNVNISGAMFIDCDFRSGNLYQLGANKKISFNGSKLNKAILSNVNFNDCNFDNSDLNELSIISSTIINLRARRASVNSLQLYHVNATEADFSLAEGNNIRILSNSNVSSSKFDRAKIYSSIISDSNLSGTSFFNSILEGTTFNKCNLSYADFTSADLGNVKFIECNIEGAKFIRLKEKPASIRKSYGIAFGINLDKDGNYRDIR